VEAAINGVRMHYEVAGDGPPVVLVHGLAASLAFWYLGVVPVLSRRFCVAAYDLRGHGLSEMPSRGYTSADLAGDLDGLLDHLGVERAHLVAHSYGAAVALRLAVSHPDRVRGLVLADAVIPHLRTGRARRPEELPLRRLLQLGEIGERRRPGAARGSRNGAGGSTERWQRLLETTSAPTDLAARDLTAAALQRVPQPALVVAGECSRVRTTSSRLATLMPYSRLEVVPGAGHFHPLMRPTEFARRAETFLTSLETDGRLVV
jgi:pimeloyl-ACP methyl ester carboxylesterase